MANSSVHLQLIAAVLEVVYSRRTLTMNSPRRFMAYLRLAALFWCTADAVALAQPTSPKPGFADRPTVLKPSRSINSNTIRWVERRYKIEAIRFKARDESGIDLLGSDEVMVKTEDAKGWTVSNKIGGIDSGDTHNFDPAKSCIVAVRPGVVILGESSVCANAGEPAPLSFQVEFWEKDTSLISGFCVVGGVPAAGKHIGPFCANDGKGDDFIGRAQVDYSTQELEAALPKVGDELIESRTLDPCPGKFCAGVPFYTFTWRVTRLSEVWVDRRKAFD